MKQILFAILMMTIAGQSFAAASSDVICQIHKYNRNGYYSGVTIPLPLRKSLIQNMVVHGGCMKVSLYCTKDRNGNVALGAGYYLAQPSISSLGHDEFQIKVCS